MPLEESDIRSNPKTEIELDLTPLPYISFPLVCPLCGNILQGFFDHARMTTVHEHMRGYRPDQCAGVGKRYVVDSRLQVQQI